MNGFPYGISIHYTSLKIALFDCVSCSGVFSLWSELPEDLWFLFFLTFPLLPRNSHFPSPVPLLASCVLVIFTALP